MLTKIPFERFIITWLLLGKDIDYIIGKLKELWYHIEEDEVSSVFEALKNILPEKLKEIIESDALRVDLNNEEHLQWLEHFKIKDFCEWIFKKNNKSIEQPDFFKWYRDCMWIHNYRDVITLVNILMFNGEPLESISDIISFKYKKKIGIETLKIHQMIFWDCSVISAKEALYHCIPFRKNVLIVKNLRSANITEIVKLDQDSDDGSDVSFVFHDSNYIKWKIGYKAIKVPEVKDFLEDVKRDSYFKYYEAMNMTQSAEVEEESGENDKIGSFESKKVKLRNVEEQKARSMKHWVDLYVKADKAIPDGGPVDDDFFDKMDQLSLDFEETKLADISDNPDMFDDIKSDMSI